MRYIFYAFGHKNIIAKHRNTFEITKHKDLTRRGDCVVGVWANYSLQKLRPFLEKKTVVLVLSAGKIKQRVTAEPNRDFSDEKEFVVRKTGFLSKRTFATNASKAAKDFNREFVNKLKNPQQKIRVVVSDECEE